MIFVDTHVHLHDVFSLTAFLDASIANFEHAASRAGAGANPTFVMVLTESFPKRCFGRFFRFAEDGTLVKGDSKRRYRFQRTREHTSVYCLLDGRSTLILVAGRQIVTSERLEVLALGIDRIYPDGQPLEQVLSDVRREGALPVIPWGFGKWFGKRGRCLAEFLASTERSQTFCLGDNGGRPVFWGEPQLFQVARGKNIRILRGSDPLPFPYEVERVGSFGFNSPAQCSLDYPTSELIQIVTDPAVQLHPYGVLDHPFGFLKKQVCMQWIKNRHCARK